MGYVGDLKCTLMVMGLFEEIIYLFSWSLVLGFLKHPSEYIALCLYQNSYLHFPTAYEAKLR
jgi:hypothetical protein